MNKAIAVRAVISALIGYLLGCISPSFLIGKRRGYDVRETGSKNAGASNTIIMAGKFAGVLVAVLDILKAAASWWIAAAMFPELEFAGQIAGAACVLGHMFPVFLGFRGGKGFACLGGLALACGPATFLLMVLLAAIIGFASSYICIAAVSMSVVFPLYYALTTGSWLSALILLLPSPFMFYKHRENFLRIAAGQELKLSFLWKKESEMNRTGHIAAVEIEPDDEMQA